MRLFKPASSEGGQKRRPPGGSPKSRVFENRQNTLGSLTFPKPSVSWGWGYQVTGHFFRPHPISNLTKSQATPNLRPHQTQTSPMLRPHQIADDTNSQTTPILRPHQLSDLTNCQATPILRPHHRLQQQQHRSLYYILPCLLLAIVVNVPKFFETETVTIRDKHLSLSKVASHRIIYIRFVIGICLILYFSSQMCKTRDGDSVSVKLLV